MAEGGFSPFNKIRIIEEPDENNNSVQLLVRRTDGNPLTEQGEIGYVSKESLASDIIDDVDLQTVTENDATTTIEIKANGGIRNTVGANSVLINAGNKLTYIDTFAGETATLSKSLTQDEANINVALPRKGGVLALEEDVTDAVSISEFKVPFGTGTGLQEDNSFSFRKGLNPDTVPYKRFILGNPTDANLLTKQAGMLIYGEEGVLPRLALIGYGNGLGRAKSTLGMWHVGGTVNAPTATPTNTIVGQPYFAAWDGVDEFREGASIIATTTGAVTPTSAPMKLEFYTSPTGSVTPLLRLQISEAGATKMFGTAESTALTITGAGTNANATYGKINLPSNAFIQGSANPLTTSSYLQFTQENSTLAGYGAWITHNAYFDGTVWRQPRGAISSNLFSANFHNNWVWRTAAAGSVNDGAITPTTVMSLTNAGLLTTASLNLSGLTASSLVFTDASKNLTSTGTVPANRGGTGITSYTVGNYVNAATTTTLQQRTPAQVAADIGALTLTGDQTVTTGIKNFVVSPTVPTPTTSTQVANKGYVDTALSTTIAGYIPYADQGVLQQLTTTAILAIPAPPEGKLYYNSTLKVVVYYDGTTWQKLSFTAM